MKNLKKNLLLLIVIFPAVIMLSSVFAEKAMGQNLPVCNYNNSPDGCGISQWCNNGTCNSCTSNFLNCDQTRGCEKSGNSCSAPTPTPSAASITTCSSIGGHCATWVNNTASCPGETLLPPSSNNYCVDGLPCCVPSSSSSTPTSTPAPSSSANCGNETCDSSWQTCVGPFGTCLKKNIAQIGSYCGTPNKTANNEACSSGYCNSSLLCADKPVWKTIDCSAPTSAPAASTANCGNQNCSSNQTCVGTSYDTQTFCFTKSAGAIGSYCGTPNKTPNNEACSSGYCDSKLQCANQPAGPTPTPTPAIPTSTLAPGVPTPTLIPVRIFTPTSTPTLTPTPTPNLGLFVCSSANKDIAPGWEFKCSSSCESGWQKSPYTNPDCTANTICCYKEPGWVQTSSTGGPSPGVSSNNTILAISLNLEGISIEKDANGKAKGNPDPKTKTRPTTIELLNVNNKLVATKTIQSAYNPAAGIFTDTANLGASFPSGNYLVKIKSERYLKRLLPGIINITSGQTITVPTLILLAGDVNGDNNIDALDYNIFVSCFGPKATTTSCANKATADVNDDGVVDGVDYNLFIHSLAIRKGD